MTRKREDLQAISCQECGRPWGVILPRSHDETDIARAELELKSEFHEWWGEMWNIDVGDDLPCPVPTSPDPKVIGVLFVSEADAHWLENTGHEINAEGGTWIEAEWFEGPAWWANRRRRLAVRWDCCDLDHPIRYAPEPVQ